MRKSTAQSFKMSKAIVMALMTLGVLSALAIYAFAFAQRSGDDVSFPNDQWDSYSITAIEVGPQYLPKDFDTGVKAPPSPNSAQTRGELRELTDNKRLRSKQQNDLIIAESQEGGVVQTFLQTGLYDPTTKPVTNALIGEFVQDVEYFMFRDKLKYRRPAPSQLSKEISVVGAPMTYPSYPSGHAIQAYMGAMILSDLDPSNENKYMALADDIAKRREIAGYNYPSDTEAGKVAAVSLYEGLKNNTDLRQLMTQAKSEF